jgi:hypothetical protein
MANVRTFAQLWNHERRSTGRGTLQRRAVGLIVLGVGVMVMGFVNGDEFALTAGSFSVAAGGAWRLCLS